MHVEKVFCAKKIFVINLKYPFIAVLAIFSLSFSICHAQKTYGGYPLGLSEGLKSLKTVIPTHKVNNFSSSQLKNLQKGATQSLFAHATKSRFTEKDGTWQQTKSGEWTWMIKFEFGRTQGSSIRFDHFNLPQGARLFLYNANGDEIHGAYTKNNAGEDQLFTSNLFRSEEMFVEYVVSAKIQPTLPFQIADVYLVTDHHAIQYGSMAQDTGFMASLTCHQNANCSEGNFLTDQKRSIAKILMVLEEGLGFCTGSLMNNTAQDDRALVLSANHCQDYLTPFYSQWRFDFNFITPACENPSATPSFNRMIGCRQLASFRDADMLLLELTDAIPGAYNVFYNGWDRNDSIVPQPSSILHHPWGDVMKVSVDNNDLRIFTNTITWDNTTVTPVDHHFRCTLDVGTHQPGSSGGPLYNNDGFVIAQLHGGSVDTVDCSNNIAYFGRISKSWDLGLEAQDRLRDWLDPLNTGVSQLIGKNATTQNANTYNFNGAILSANSEVISNVAITLDGQNVQATFFTDSLGRFRITDIPENEVFTASLSKNMNAGNGLSSADLVQIQRHILGLQTFDDPIRIAAADVSGDGGASAVDLVQIIRVILGLSETFSSGKSWDFQPNQFQFPITDEVLDVSITGYKLGDVNFSADPQG